MKQTMKSLQKTLDILEYISLRNGESVTPCEAADALQVNPATCTRIMGELVKRGYLEKISRRSGYVIGPMIAAMNTRDNLFTRIAKAADKPLRHLCRSLDRQVNIAVMHGTGRIMLCFHFNDPLARPWTKFLMDDHPKTATGRLLLSCLDDVQARKVCEKCGMEYSAEYFAQVRRDGFVRFEENDLVIIGHSVIVPGYPAAAFGFGVKPEFADRAMELSAETAAAIRVRLLPQSAAY